MFKFAVNPDNGRPQIEFRDKDGGVLLISQNAGAVALCMPLDFIPVGGGTLCNKIALENADVMELYRQLGEFLLKGSLDIDLTWG
jgi:hypothetical protein